jgi:Zn-dependent metalloprotease
MLPIDSLDCYQSYQNILTVVDCIDQVIENPNHRLQNYIASINYCQKEYKNCQGEYKNAHWYPAGRQAIFGQKSINSNLCSYATDLTIIVAHEFCHGLIAQIHGKGGLDRGEINRDTRRTKYPESSALEESLCDIFAILVCNRDRPIENWQWQIGSNFGDNGGAERDLTQEQYNEPPYQNGYNPNLDFYDNSIIHSRAFYHLMNSPTTDNSNSYLFNADFAIQLFSQILIRVQPERCFADSHRIFLAVAQKLRIFRNQTQSRQQEIIQAINEAFEQVGIS